MKLEHVGKVRQLWTFGTPCIREYFSVCISRERRRIDTRCEHRVNIFLLETNETSTLGKFDGFGDLEQPVYVSASRQLHRSRIHFSTLVTNVIYYRLF